MTAVPLTEEQISRYHRDGFLFPLQALTEEQVALLQGAIDDHLERRFASQLYELTDPIRVRRVEGPGHDAHYEYDTGDNSPATTFPFLFNLWKTDSRFRAIGLDPALANWARLLLGTERVLLMEDNVVIKNGNTGRLPWHQDYSYWPLAEPAAVTVWIALDPIDSTNGAMEVVPGSHEWGERLPVSFGDGIPFMAEDRPGVSAVPADPRSDNYEVVNYQLLPGECGLHSPMLWHASAPNASPRPRRAFILRYVAAGTVWLGESRFPYDDIGCPVGSPLTEKHFPAAAPRG